MAGSGTGGQYSGAAVWAGYALGAEALYSSNPYDLSLAHERPRYIGVSKNRVIGGLLLHTTRR